MNREGILENVARHYDRTGNTSGGPDWYDINVLLCGLERTSGRRLRLEMQPITAVGGRWGFCIHVRVAAGEAIFGSAGYGPAYPSGARTLEGACYNAIWKATQELEDDVCHGDCMGGARTSPH